VVLEREALKLSNRTAHVALFDTFNDSEVGLLLVDLRTGRFTGECFDVVAIAEARDPITTMGGVRMVPDAALAELDPSGSDVLVLAGGDMWDAGGGRVFVDAAKRFLDAGVPVAAICGATAGLARGGVLDERKPTSASAEYLAMTGYAGRHHYVDERAVIDGDLITAGPQSPVQFARATLARLGLASERTLDAYERLFHGADTSAFPVLMQTGAGG
jgi:putative intracellular protease/amidase